LDDELLKPYFQLENVLNGAFTIAEKLFGITFKEVFDIDTYHEDVQTFEVLDFDVEKQFVNPDVSKLQQLANQNNGEIIYEVVYLRYYLFN
jgi:hypothetical protein